METDRRTFGRLADKLEGAPPDEILAWAWRDLGPALAMSTAFGPSGVVLVDMAQRVVPQLPVFTIDTGYLFSETLALKKRIEARYNIQIESLRPRLSVPEQDSVCGPDLYNRDPDRCCAMRKVEPLQRKLASLNGWIAGLRRDQSGTRAGVRVVEGYQTSGGRDVTKINPLAAWTRKQVWDYIIENDLPYNSLMDQGYSSIGCRPCTQPAAPGADERAGRWAGTCKSECGMHVPLMEVEIPEAEGQLAAG
ncbi:MAG: phosphoadenylyl-sulfate reductase [Candidatus Latescibacteria bacterium]|nr:phosphoadenylyl-sulfate reductase [Candidatus Latescibacterota bacterium]